MVCSQPRSSCLVLHGKRVESPCALCSAVAYCCGAVAPRAIAALLGRFLPRLGPPVHSPGGPFFWTCHPTQPRHSGMRLLGRRPGMTARRLLSRGLERAEIAERNLRQRLGERGKILDYL